jgi:hypothetical protein
MTEYKELKKSKINILKRKGIKPMLQDSGKEKKWK